MKTKRNKKEFSTLKRKWRKKNLTNKKKFKICMGLNCNLREMQFDNLAHKFLMIGLNILFNEKD